MKRQGAKQIYLKQETQSEQILRDWLAAITCFHYVYSQINGYLDEHGRQEKSEQWVGQCPADELRDLLVTMQQDLETMLNDVEQFGHPLEYGQYDQLAFHAQRLHELNQKARNLLHLAVLKAQ